MTDERNEVWDRLRAATLKRLWLRILILIVIVAFDIFWLAKGQTFFTTQVESILFSVGSVEVVLFRRTLFLSDFQTDIIQNGGW
jgi:4-amino-4-deoxy-L-arabinose transferase-like glycosyltransferase